MFEPSQHLRQQAADLRTARDFSAPYAVTFPLDPSVPGEDILIDQISDWARSEERFGRHRRTVRAHQGEVEFRFEADVDAVWCKLRFG
jgi:hypothetical protein